MKRKIFDALETLGVILFGEAVFFSGAFGLLVIAAGGLDPALQIAAVVFYAASSSL